jgi:predicted transcriptional regulator
MVYRTRNEIFASILRCAAKNKNGTRITRIMYESFLSDVQVSHYLNDLTRLGFLINEIENEYKVTQKGMGFIHLVQNMDELLKH